MQFSKKKKIYFLIFLINQKLLLNKNTILTIPYKKKISTNIQFYSTLYQSHKTRKKIKKTSHHELTNLPLNFTDECIKYPLVFPPWVYRSVNRSFATEEETTRTDTTEMLKKKEKRKKWLLGASLLLLKKRQRRIERARKGREREKKRRRKLEWLRVDNSVTTTCTVIKQEADRSFSCTHRSCLPRNYNSC